MKKLFLPAISVFLILFLLTACPSPNIKPKPGIPSNPSPVNSSSRFDTTFYLSWSCTSPDNSTLVYDVYMGTSINSLEKLVSTTSNNFQVTDLVPGSMYYWKVIAKNPWNESSASPLWSFRVLSKKPYNPSPENSSRISGTETTLGWEAYRPENTVPTYDLHYGSTPEATHLVENISNNFYELDNLATGTTYYWKIIIKDSLNNSTEGDLWSFSINNPPVIYDLSPSNGATDTERTVDLSWNGVDSDNDALTYRIYFGSTPSPSLVATGFENSSYSIPAPLEYDTVYYWKVEGNDGIDVSQTAVHSFTTETNIAPLINELSPSDNATAVSINSVISWDCSDPNGDTIIYDLYFGTAPEPSIIATDIVESIYSFQYPLDYQTTYYWKLIAKDSAGKITESAIYSFTTETSLPPIINSISPSDSATAVSINSKLSWNCTDPNDDPLTYSVYFGKTASPSMVATGIETASYSFEGPLEYETTYYWKLIANDGLGGKTTSSLLTFITEKNFAPVINSMSPSNDSTDVSIYTTLSWNCSDPNGDAVTYNLYFGDTTSPSILATGLANFSYSFVAALEYSKTYYWKIEAADAYGKSSESELHSFTTEPNYPPIFNFMSPSDNSANISMTTNLEWNFTDPNENPMTYNLFFGENPAPSQIATELSWSSYSFENPLNPLTTYYWRVSANDGNGEIIESPVYQFTTKLNSAPVIESVSPSDEAGGISVDTDLTWTVTDADNDPISFELYFGETASPTLVATDMNTNSYSFDTPLNPSTTYYWRLIANDGMGEITESPIYEFTTSINISYTISRYGGNEFDAFYTSLEKTTGGYIFAGYTKSDNFTDYIGGTDAWIVKLDSDMNSVWEKCLGGTGEDHAENIQETGDGGYIAAGWTRSTDIISPENNGSTDAWIVKLDSSGNTLWQKSLGGTGDDYAKSILEVSDGYLFAGFTDSNDGNVSGNHGGKDAWVVKLDFSGNLSWQKCFGGTGDEEINSLQNTSDNNYIIAGYTSSDDNDVSHNNGGKDSWVMKFDSSSSIIWESTFGGSGSENTYSIRETDDGGFVFAGYTQSSEFQDFRGYRDGWMAKINIDGAMEWQKCFGGTGIDEFYSLRNTSDDGYILSGYTYSNDKDVSDNHGVCDAWIVNLNSGGKILWQRCIGGSSSDYANTILEISTGKYVTAGNTSSSNGDMPGDFGNTDAWIGIIEEQ